MSHILKLARAKNQCNALYEAMQARAQRNPHGVVLKEDVNEGVLTRVILYEESEPIPETWALDIGDILYNIRSSLDHLAFALNVAGAGRELSIQEGRTTQFPISGIGDPLSNKTISNYVGLVCPEAKTFIDSIQPYNSTDPVNDPLYILNVLHNADKHRKLNVVCSSVAHGQLEIGEGFIEGRLYNEPRCENGTHLAKYVGTPEMKVNIHFTFAEYIYEPTLLPGRYPPIETIERIGWHVKNIVFSGLERFL